MLGSTVMGMFRTLLSSCLLVAPLAACSTSSEPSTYGAEIQCERFLEDRLRSPGSADFSLTTTGGPTTFTSTGTVDSENGFGALVRSDVRCVVSVSGDTWTLTDWAIDTR